MMMETAKTKDNQKQQHMADNIRSKTIFKNKMVSTILDSFNKLAYDKDNERIDGAITLLRHLSKGESDDNDEKELQYALTRLVRGMGTSRINARKGFFAALTAFLSITSKNLVTRIIELLESELHVVGSNSKSEEAEIYTGRILVCGALIHSKVYLSSTTDEQQKLLLVLIEAGKKRSYLSSASYSFIIDLVDQLEEEDFKSIAWPLLKKELAKPWTEQSLDTLHALIVIDKKYPNLLKGSFMRKNFNSKTIVDENSLDSIASLLMGLPMILSLKNPVYKLFSEELSNGEHVAAFWNIIDKHLATPLRNKMLVAIEIAIFILSSVKDTAVIPSLITDNFLRNILRIASANKRKKNDEVVIKIHKFFEILVSTMKRDDVQPKTRITLLKKLLLNPGDITIEKQTGTKVIQILTSSLTKDGVKKLAKIYAEITAAIKQKDKIDKTVVWTNMERIYAAQMLTRLMSHPSMTAEDEWKLEQLKFLFKFGLCQNSTVGVELAASLKESFYRALDLKLPKLNDLRKILSSLVHYIDEEILSNGDNDNESRSELRLPLSDEGVNSWREMIKLIKKLEINKKSKSASPIFHTMELHMGLQLFSEPDMAVNSIKDLHSCFERLERKKKNKSDNNDDDEPEWVEVVVDLMLSLLSRSSHLLRSLVGCVFPHICPMLTASSIHQILDVLDPKNDKNPLSSKKGDEESSSEEEGEEEEEELGEDEVEEEEEEDEEDEEEVESEEKVEEEEEEEEEEDDLSSDSDPDDDIEDENYQVNDKLRMAVRQALGDAMGQTDDEDMDVDEIDEEEGQRLNSALSSAFKVLRENRETKNNKKQGKSAQALTHFRVRVVDLLQIYLDSNPSLSLVIDILLPLFALLEYSIKDQHQKPLENRIRSCLKRLSTVKKFSDTDGVTPDTLTDVLKTLIDKGSKSAPVYHEMGDKLTECCTFLVRCSQQISEEDDHSFENIYADILETFFKKRDCVLPVTLFKSVLNLQWIGNWRLAPYLVDFAFDKSIRPFRRNQALEFLDIFYHNNRLVKANEIYNETRVSMEKNLSSKSVELLKEIGNNDKNNEAKQGIKQKFVYLLLSLLYTIKNQHQSTSACDWKSIGNAMKIYRVNVTLAKDAKTAYNRLANKLGIPINISTATSQKEENKTSNSNGQHIKSNGKLIEEEIESADDETKINGVAGDDDDDDKEEESINNKQTKKEKKKKQKIKSKQKDKQLLKKEARELRIKAMSDGLDSLAFTSVPVNYVNDVDMVIADKDMSENGAGGSSDKSNYLNDKERQNDKESRNKRKKRTASSSSLISQDISFKSNKKKK